MTAYVAQDAASFPHVRHVTDAERTAIHSLIGPARPGAAAPVFVSGDDRYLAYVQRVLLPAPPAAIERAVKEVLDEMGFGGQHSITFGSSQFGCNAVMIAEAPSSGDPARDVSSEMEFYHRLSGRSGPEFDRVDVVFRRA